MTLHMFFVCDHCGTREWTSPAMFVVLPSPSWVFRKGKVEEDGTMDVRHFCCPECEHSYLKRVRGYGNARDSADREQG